MTQVTARLPSALVEKADRVAAQLNCSRAQLLRQALECYLDDFDDLRLALDGLNDPADPILDWEGVKRDLACSRSRVEPPRHCERSAVPREPAHRREVYR